MNILGWKTEEFELEYVTGKIVGYVFTIDGKMLEFDDFLPLIREYIEEVDYLSDTKSPRKAPYVACCSCGIVECNAVYTIVKFDGEMVSWTVFRFYFGTIKIEGEYRFDKTQYYQAVHSLLEHIKVAKANEGAMTGYRIRQETRLKKQRIHG